MDIIAEIVSLFLESYFGWDEYEIAELWRTRPGRRRSIVRRIGSSLPAISPRIFSKRSIVREIGSRLPLPPVKRPHFKVGSNLHCNSNHTNVQDGDINWIMGPEYFEECTFSCINDDQSDGLLLSLCDETDDELADICSKETRIPTSTPSVTPEIIIMDNDLAMKKISALEDELNRLRVQIASLVVAQPCTPSIGSIGPMTSTPCTPAPPCTFAPPPPPPPPPPILTPVKSVIDVIRENRSRRRTIAGALPCDKPLGAPNMADVLKGLGTVKLKSIERSPGGTPVRKKPLETEGTDPSSIIARALKKKFAQRRKLKDADSPSVNKENTSSFSPSPAKLSPRKPLFGPHLLKSSKERRKSGSDLKNRVLQTSPLVNIKA